MQTLRIVITIFVVMLVMSSCATHGRINEVRSRRFDRYLARLAREYIEAKPRLIAYTGKLEHLGMDTPRPG